MGSKASLKGKHKIFIADIAIRNAVLVVDDILPCEKILCEVKYRLHDVGITRNETVVPILRVPALAFLYLLSKAEAEGLSGKL